MIPFAPDFTTGYELKFSYTGTISSDTDTDGTAIDTQDWEGPIHVFAIIGNYGDASTATTIKLRQASTSGGTYSDVTGASSSLSASATANDNSTVMFRADNVSARYVKVRVTTSGGGTPSVPIAVAVFAKKKIGGNSGVQTSVSA